MAAQVGRWFRFDEKDERIMVMCGMSAAFSALFGAPLTAAVFSLEVISVGVMYYSALVPCVLSAVVGCGVAVYFGVIPVRFHLTGIPEMGALPLEGNPAGGIVRCAQRGVLPSDASFRQGLWQAAEKTDYLSHFSRRPAGNRPYLIYSRPGTITVRVWR